MTNKIALFLCCSWAWPHRGYLQTQRVERSAESGCTDTSLIVLQSQDAETQQSQMRTVTIVGLVLYHNDECLKWRKVLRARMQITKHSKKHSKSGSLDTCLWIPRSQNTETLQHCKENPTNMWQEEEWSYDGKRCLMYISGGQLGGRGPRPLPLDSM